MLALLSDWANNVALPNIAARPMVIAIFLSVVIVVLLFDLPLGYAIRKACARPNFAESSPGVEPIEIKMIMC
jgi:hypothetical protein